jgi:hypothetical protein
LSAWACWSSPSFARGILGACARDQPLRINIRCILVTRFFTLNSGHCYPLYPGANNDRPSCCQYNTANLATYCSNRQASGMTRHLEYLAWRRYEL